MQALLRAVAAARAARPGAVPLTQVDINSLIFKDL